MSSEVGLAHELYQPLGVITNYANGCLRRLESGTVDKQALVHAFLRIAEQAERAGRIGHLLRSWFSCRRPEVGIPDLDLLPQVSLEPVQRGPGTLTARELAPPESILVYVVDDDRETRDSLSFFLEALGWEARSFVSAEDFLARYSPSRAPACLLLEVRMPGMSGLDLQAVLGEYGIELPTILSAANADVPMVVRAMGQGAVDFLEKPFQEQQLRESIERAVARDSGLQRMRGQEQETRRRLAGLTPREREVLRLVVRGLLNKQIASELGLSVKTVEQHRGRVMEKMAAESLASLVRMAVAAGLT